jgi:outer membrane protein OmpA-like peptidoglycan-associated protein
MEIGAIVALLVGACFGILLASRHFMRLRLPVWAAVMHGVAGATGFTLLLLTVLSNPAFTLAKRALFVLVVAVFMGCVNVVFHIRRIRHRTGLILGHAALAVSGVTTFVVGVVLRPPKHAPPIEAPKTQEPESRDAPQVAARPAATAHDEEVTHADVAALRRPAGLAVKSPTTSGPGLREVRAQWSASAWRIDFDVATVSPRGSAQATLRQVATALAKDATIRLVDVRGYADERGDDARNLALTRARASAVVDALVALGVDRTRLRAAGVGARCPADRACAESSAPARCHAEDAWSRDRRVDFDVVQVNDESDADPVVCTRGAESVRSTDGDAARASH